MKIKFIVIIYIFIYSEEGHITHDGQHKGVDRPATVVSETDCSNRSRWAAITREASVGVILVLGITLKCLHRVIFLQHPCANDL